MTSLWPGVCWVAAYWLSLCPRDHSVYGLSQWVTTLHCNIVSNNWLSPYTEWSHQHYFKDFIKLKISQQIKHNVKSLGGSFESLFPGKTEYEYFLKNFATNIPDSKVHLAKWGPSGADRTQAGPMLAPWTLLSGMSLIMTEMLQITLPDTVQVLGCSVSVENYFLAP